MFSRKEQLLKKTGPDGIGRYEFLKQLVTEYTTTRSREPKKQVLANLANFAYDPINFEYFRQLHIVDLFLAQLSEDDEELLNFAIAGLCNIASDPDSQEYIISLNGVNLISSHLNHTHEEIALNALTSLYFLFANKSIPISKELHEKISLYESSTNPRFRNLGKVFLEQYCHLVIHEKAT